MAKYEVLIGTYTTHCVEIEIEEGGHVVNTALQKFDTMVDPTSYHTMRVEKVTEIVDTPPEEPTPEPTPTE